MIHGNQDRAVQGNISMGISMRQINFKIFRTGIMFLMILFLSSMITVADGSEKKETTAQPKDVSGDSYSMEIEFTGNRPDTRIAKTDISEITVAFKMKSEGDDFILGSGKQKFAGIKYERLPGGAGAVFLKTHDIIDGYESKWIQDGKILQISVRTKKTEVLKQPEKTIDHTEKKKDGHKKSSDTEFVSSIKDMPCLSGGELNSAYIAISNENWDSATEIIDEYITDKGNEGKCLDAAFFLRAYIFYRTRANEDSAEARRLFQETMLKFPDSPYLPYSALYLGELELSLAGYAPAAGYFGYILNEFPDFRAKPQAIYGYAISSIHLDNLVTAYKALSDLGSKFPGSSYNENAAYHQGIIFFKRGDYEDALRRFEAHIDKNRDQIYESPELLYYMGSSAYHSGNYKKAIDYLSKAYNLFPEIEEPDILFSRIADSYVEEGQLEKARKIYELVRSKYNGTDGFAVSSIRLAGITENPEEKESIYQEVIDEFPDNPLSKLSMLRIARSRYDSGDYRKSLEVLEKLLSEKPGATKKEADELIILALEKFFVSMVSEGKFFDAVSSYETKQKSIVPYMTPMIQYLVGKSYLKLGLHEPAYQHISEAGKAFANRKKPEGFDYDMAVALQETGKTAEAKNMLTTVSSSDTGITTDALKRLAGIQMSEGKTDEALNTYREIFSKSRTPYEKTLALLDQAAVHEKNQDVEGMVSALSMAEELLASDNSDQKRETMLKTLKKLGEARSKNQDLIGASAAFEKALKLKKEGENLEEISFLLADTYDRIGKTSEASEIFKKISEGDNDFWAKLANERLEEIAFLKKLKAPEKKMASQ